ncbi:uncharacterized protein LOC143446237 [Clavelina lepadiformis]|uniref:uncharacterized protein LOC143446237 n=1 Tax=Clavelina lepadiformis TaxID=159417 RepID=UPI0040416530
MARLSPGIFARKNTSKRMRKNELFSRISALCGTILLAGLTNDIIQYTIMEKPLLTTQAFTYIMLVFHIISFFTSIEAFVYTTSRYKCRTETMSCCLIFFNGLLFLFRVILESVLMNYRREYYNS